MKICFANEIGNVCKAVGVDSHDVMDIFCQDDKLNISKAYMKPGFAFGGSCLPKDVRALAYRAKELDLELPLIEAVLPSNRRQIQHAIDRIVESGCRTVGMLGLSFKAGTDDLRESPLVILAEALLGKGYTLRIYDRNITIGRLIGANRAYIEEQIPHLARLMCDSADEVVDASELLVLGNASPDFADALARTREDQVIIDLVRTSSSLAAVVPPTRAPSSKASSGCSETLARLHLGCGKFFVRAFDVVDAVPIEVPDTRPDFLHQILVVRDEEHGALVALQRDVQRVDRFQVEVVGRLVQHQDVRLLQHDPAEEQARRLAAGQRLGRLVAFLTTEEHLAEQAVDVLARGGRVELVQPFRRRQALGDRAGVVLREVADRDLVSPADGAAIDVAR